MRVRKGSEPWKTVPTAAGLLETINIGTRAAVIFSPIDLSCGWDADANPIEGGVLYDQNDALKLGSNIVTYCLAEYQYGRFFDHQKVYHQATDATRDQLVLGQIVHNGDWDPTPHGVPNLLKTIDQIDDAARAVQARAGRSGEGGHFQLPRAVHDRPARISVLRRNAANGCAQYLDHGGTLIVDDVDRQQRIRRRVPQGDQADLSRTRS